MSQAISSAAPRGIVYRTRGHRGGPITRLMSPGDLGQRVKPFVFLDLFDTSGAPAEALSGMPIHPHSGVATVTVFTEGGMRFDDPASGTGTLGFGGVEWMRAGGGVWHGKELWPVDVPRIQGFQLWLSLPAELELSEPQSRYIEADGMRQAGPAWIVVGEHEGVQSPVPAPAGINYLLVRLGAGERWHYQPPAGHAVGWLAVAQGTLDANGAPASAGEMVVFEAGEGALALEAGSAGEAVFVLGTAVPHPHDLHLGNYSVHTSPAALATGEQRIRELGQKLQQAGDRRTATGNVPVFR